MHVVCQQHQKQSIMLVQPLMNEHHCTVFLCVCVVYHVGERCLDIYRICETFCENRYVWCTQVCVCVLISNIQPSLQILCVYIEMSLF